MSSTKSGKAKGRRLQNWVRDQLKLILYLTGADVKLTSDEARKVFPFDIECKNAESVNVWKAYEQASQHGELEPLLIIKKNGKKPLVVLDATYFMKEYYG